MRPDMSNPDTVTMTGAQALVGTLADNGVTACFANPGTSEMHLVTALDGEPRIRSVLCLKAWQQGLQMVLLV